MANIPSGQFEMNFDDFGMDDMGDMDGGGMDMGDMAMDDFGGGMGDPSMENFGTNDQFGDDGGMGMGMDDQAQLMDGQMMGADGQTHSLPPSMAMGGMSSGVGPGAIQPMYYEGESKRNSRRDWLLLCVWMVFSIFMCLLFLATMGLLIWIGIKLEDDWELLKSQSIKIPVGGVEG